MITSKIFSNQYYSNWGNIFVPCEYKSLIISVGCIWGSEATNKHNASIAHKSYWGVTCLPIFHKSLQLHHHPLSSPKTTLHNQKTQTLRNSDNAHFSPPHSQKTSHRCTILAQTFLYLHIGTHNHHILTNDGRVRHNHQTIRLWLRQSSFCNS